MAPPTSGAICFAAALVFSALSAGFLSELGVQKLLTAESAGMKLCSSANFLVSKLFEFGLGQILIVVHHPLNSIFEYDNVEVDQQPNA